MSEVRIILFRETNGSVPIIDWLKDIKMKRARAKCLTAIKLLAHRGHELRRPHADHLRGGIRELRIREGNVNYRILFFFHGRDIVVLTNGLTKESVIPNTEIEKAWRMKMEFEKSPAKHTHILEKDDEIN